MFGWILNRHKLLADPPSAPQASRPASRGRSRLAADAKLLGRWGEKRCERFLKRKGFHKLVSNFPSKAGEIDLVMVAPDGTVVFVEVKTRTSESFEPAESSITTAKKAKLFRTAKYFLATHKIENRPCRFDIVTVVLGQTGPAQIMHYENAFVV